MKINSKKILKTVALLVVLCFSVLSPPGKALAAATTSAAIVPMYEYPTIGTYWSDILGAGGDTVPFAIVNPANGPGTTVDPIYTSSIANMTAGGTRAIAYVDTSYHARSFQSVIDDIDDWYTMYPDITGIFIDQVRTINADDLCYAAGLYNHVKSTHPNDLVMLNPGTNIPQAYEPYGDIFLNAENTYAAYQAGWSPIAGWEDNPAYQNRFWHTIHTVSSANYAAAMTLARSNNAGWVFLTDDTMPNPYHVTPSYWSTEEADLDALPNPTVPNRGLTQLPSGCQSLSAATANANTVSAKQVKTTSNITIANTDTSYPADSGSKIAFTLPTGVAFAGSGSNWTCAGNNCSYNTVIAASGSAAVLAAEFTAGCDYSSGNVTGVLSNFAGNQTNFSVTPTRPADCAAGELANTGLPMGALTAIAGGVAILAGAAYITRTRVHYVHQTVRRRSRW